MATGIEVSKAVVYTVLRDPKGIYIPKSIVYTVLSVPGDTTPDAFSFTDVTDADLSTVYESDEITVAGIDDTANVSIAGGEYSKNGGAYTSDAGTCVVGDTFTVRVTSSGSPLTAVDATLTIGGVSDTYTVTTAGGSSASTSNMFLVF